MPKNLNETRTSLQGRVAAEKAAQIKTAKTKAAAAWTIAKTMLPEAPNAEQVKFAQSLMTASPTALKVALRHTALNAHFTRIAEQFSKVHKVDLNDLLEDPSILTKEEKAVQTELKGEAKNAGKKVADDRKDAGPLPAEYPEPTRNEPEELDGKHAGEGRPDSWTDGPGSKEAAAKKACEGGCSGDCEHKKEAAAKTAEEGEEHSEEHSEEHTEEAAPEADEFGDADEADADEADADEADEDFDEEGDSADVAADAAGDADETETFDPEKANLEEAAADIEADVERLQDAIAELSEDPEDMSLAPEADVDFDLGGEAEADPEFATEGGEELNLDDIFNEQNMTDKVSALNDEGDDVIEAHEDFFAPSDPSELEAVLEQEEGLTHPGDIFAIEEDAHDPLAAIFASKQASEGIVAPGDLESFFETDLKGDDRDADSDHDGDIFSDVYSSIKQPTRTDQRDTAPKLKEPTGKEATKKAAAGIRRLKPTVGASKSAASNNVNLAALLFTDEQDFA